MRVYAVSANNGQKDVISVINNIVSSLQDGDTVRFEKDIYHIYPENCIKKFYYVSNNDGSEKSVALYLKDKKNITVDGGGCEFVFHGRISPVILDNCQNITIKGITFDYAEKFYFQGVVEKAGKDYVNILLDDNYRYYFKDGIFRIKMENCESVFDCEHLCIAQEFDPLYRRVAYKSWYKLFYFCTEEQQKTIKTDWPAYVIKEISPNRLCIEGGGMGNYTTGNILVVNGEKRYNSTVFAVDCTDLDFQDLHIVNSTAMGIICQTCENVYLKNIRCVLKDGQRGMVTSNADATHFVNCSGKILLDSCRFENMLDDGCNIHGIFTEIVKIAEDKMLLELKHYQQYGVNIYKKGDKIAVYKGDSLCGEKLFTVASACLKDERHILLKTEEQPDGLNEGDQVENISRNPEVLITSCVIRNNRPHGILIATNRKAVIENCLFTDCQSAINVAGNNKNWFESGGITDLTVKNNLFYDCCHMGGDHIIMIYPVGDKENPDNFYHKNFKILNNRFFTDVPYILFAEKANGIQLSGNQVFSMADQRMREAKTELINCINVVNE